MPVPKKNRVRLGTTREEDDDGGDNDNDNDSTSNNGSNGSNADATTPPPGSPGKGPDAADLVTSPRFESNVRQISRQVSTMTWEEGSGQPPPSSLPESAFQDIAELSAETVLELEPVVPTPPPPGTTTSTISMANEDNVAEADIPDIATPGPQTEAPSELGVPPASVPNPTAEADEPDKPLKRKIADRLPSASVEEPPSKVGTEPAKRARDDPEEDVNPREKKRPTPPPEEREGGVKPAEDVAEVNTPEPASPQPKIVCSFSSASRS